MGIDVNMIKFGYIKIDIKIGNKMHWIKLSKVLDRVSIGKEIN